MNFKTCTKGFLNGGAWSTFFPSPSIPHCLLFGNFILTGSIETEGLQPDSEYLPFLIERKAPHAKRTSPYLSCALANSSGRAELLLLSFFPLPHGGIMLSSRIRRGYLKSPISFCLQCVGRLPSLTPCSPAAPLALYANRPTTPLAGQCACAEHLRRILSIRGALRDAAFKSPPECRKFQSVHIFHYLETIKVQHNEAVWIPKIIISKSTKY